MRSKQLALSDGRGVGLFQVVSTESSRQPRQKPSGRDASDMWNLAIETLGHEAIEGSKREASQGVEGRRGERCRGPYPGATQRTPEALRMTAYNFRLRTLEV